MNNNAIVIMWQGKSASDHVIKEIATVLFERGISVPETTNIVYMDQKAIAKALANNGMLKIDITDIEKSTTEAIKNACYYITTRFKRYLECNATVFAVALSEQVSKATKESNEDAAALLSAVEIIAVHDDVVAHRTGMSKQICEVIRTVYNSFM